MIWAVVCLTSVASGILQTVAGFGSVMLMMMIFPFFFDMVQAPGLSLIINYLFCLALCWRYRKHISFSLALVPTLTYAAVSTAIVFTIGAIDMRILQIAFGVFFMALSVYFLVFAKHMRVKPTMATGLVCGTISGISSGFFAVGGPPMALYFVAAAENQMMYVASMQFLFTVTNTVNILSRVYNGLLGADLLPYAAAGTVSILLGMWLGQKINGKLNADKTRTIVYIFVGISGLVNVLQNI